MFNFIPTFSLGKSNNMNSFLRVHKLSYLTEEPNIRNVYLICLHLIKLINKLEKKYCNDEC